MRPDTEHDHACPRDPHRRVGDSGIVLLGVLVLVFVMAIVGSAFLSLAGNETRVTQQDLNSQRAFWLAEGGRDRALRWLEEQVRPPDQDLVIYDGVAGPDGGSYTVSCRVDSSDYYSPEKNFVLESVGSYAGRERRVRQWLLMHSFSRYAYFTEEELGPQGYSIWWGSDDVIEGWLHTNGTMRINGSPRFLGEVTSASNRMIGFPNHIVYGPEDWPVGSNDPYFAQGFELGYERIPLPTHAGDLEDLAQHGGVYENQAAELELGVIGEDEPIFAPGHFRYRRLSPPESEWISVHIAGLHQHVFFCGHDLRVKGILDGEFTIACGRDLLIQDDILYLASDGAGAPLPGCDDLLGLIAERDIVLVNNAANQDNLLIDGVLMALNTSIYAEDYNQGPPRGVLTIWGGLIQRRRGAVGTIQNGTLTHGYRKAYHYDERMTGHAPPAFPLTGVYEELNWIETWDESHPF